MIKEKSYRLFMIALAALVAFGLFSSSSFADTTDEPIPTDDFSSMVEVEDDVLSPDVLPDSVESSDSTISSDESASVDGIEDDVLIPEALPEAVDSDALLSADVSAAAASAGLLSDVAIGDTVYLNVHGVPTEFIVVQQGKPSDLYDDSCDGTWLLMKDVYENRQWHSSSDNFYAASAIHSYLNSEFLALFDSNIQSQIKQVKIPYVNGNGVSGSVASGFSGLSCKIFLLSVQEVGFSLYNPVDGVKLSYFVSGSTSAAKAKRIANRNGSAINWWLRSPYSSFSSSAWLVLSDGDRSYANCFDSFGIRPTLILPFDLFVSDDGFVVAENPDEPIPTDPPILDDSVFLEKSFDDYTVTEGLLFVIALLLFIFACVRILKEGFSWL